MKDNLTHDNYLLLCATHYRNAQCSGTEEFLDDLKRIKYLKKIFTRYESSNNIDERLVLNHIIILNNVFGPKFLNRMLFLKMFDQMKYIKPFLIFLNLLPQFVDNVDGKIFDSTDIPMDERIIEKLREFGINK